MIFSYLVALAWCTFAEPPTGPNIGRTVDGSAVPCGPCHGPCTYDIRQTLHSRAIVRRLSLSVRLQNGRPLAVRPRTYRTTIVLRISCECAARCVQLNISCCSSAQHIYGRPHAKYMQCDTWHAYMGENPASRPFRSPDRMSASQTTQPSGEPCRNMIGNGIREACPQQGIEACAIPRASLGSRV